MDCDLKPSDPIGLTMSKLLICSALLLLSVLISLLTMWIIVSCPIVRKWLHLQQTGIN